ncbi:uncharacterized protein LOC124818802 [Hydra vulgaris]|uniref:uncharacterized protein LOC124818802 n=1 Tax=Hydra vulgaris TaxID=6087 RepID=UPI0032E9CDAA
MLSLALWTLFCLTSEVSQPLLSLQWLGKFESQLRCMNKLYIKSQIQSTYQSYLWSPYTICLINKVEKVQRFFTKRIAGPWSVSYDKRLAILKLNTLEYRRVFKDLVLCYKIFNAINKEEISQLIESKIHSSDDEILSDNNNVIESRHKHGHKKHYCLYCEKLLSKIPRHLEHIHKHKELRGKGDFNVNINNIKNSEKITSVRKCTVNKDDELLPCEYCYGFFRARKLCEHVSKCFLRGSDNKEISYIKASRILVGQSSLTDNAKIVHEYILTTMKHDKLHLVIRNDKLLLTYGAVEVGKKEKDRYHDVGYALRVLAKLLLQYRKQFNAEDASANDLVNAISYDNIISSMKVCADYCGPRKIGNPRLVLRIGYSLKTLAIIVKLEYLKLGLGYGRKRQVETLN